MYKPPQQQQQKEPQEPNNTEAQRASRKKRFFRVRVSILLFILFVVVLYAVRDLRSRQARKDWDKTLDVAVVLVEVSGRDKPDPAAIRELQERAAALETRLAAEAERHHPGAPRPFRLRLHGPVEVSAPPPTPATESAVDLAKQAVDLERWLHEVDPRSGITPEHWDTRIYVSIRRPANERRTMVEGQSQQNGRIGVVDVELDASMADLTLFVITHELMHTLGATDKYDAAGRTLIPDGLAEPDREPRYPQRFAEVMARNRPVSETEEKIPVSIDELAIGTITAKEIGWVR